MRHVAVQGAQGRAARRLRERDKRERVTGAIGRELLPMGLGRADSLRGREAVEDNAQPMGGLAMRGHFKSARIRSAGAACSASGSSLPTVGWRFTSTLPTFASTPAVLTMTPVVHRFKPLCSIHQRRAVRAHHSLALGSGRFQQRRR